MKKITSRLYIRKDRLASALSYGAAFVIVVMLTLQLFGYDMMTDILGVLLPAGWVRSLPVILAVIVVIELLSLPYFLPIALSKLARIFAWIFAWLVPLVWLGVMFIALDSVEQATVPLFGNHVDIPLGLPSVSMMFLLLAVVGTLTSLDIKARRT